ncbi:MAG: DNA-3-methyladenine glycosylase I [Bergeyella sp.]|nr:DNA-3-methyladenine glycosylase I [Bergeyella sp.]
MEAVVRCPWCEKDDLYRNYHDKEWGKPVHEDKILFEFLVLEIFQAGLSWHTVLKKRAHFRNALDGFDYKRIAQYQEEKIQELLKNKDIIRNRLKIESIIRNAGAFLVTQREFGSFSDYVWSFVGGCPVDIHPKTLGEIPAKTECSTILSKDLKKRGFMFMGPTVVYAFMQAIGMVNDHLEGCWTRSKNR